MAKPPLSNEKILERARHGIYVAKYTWRDEALRKKCRRLARDGKLVREWSDRGGFFYRTAP